MSKTILNLTQQSIISEIEQILEQYPDHPYQQAFAHPDLRQVLVVWVLNRIPNVFTTIEESESVVVHPTYAPYCSDRESCTEFVIRQGIQEVLCQNQSEIDRHVPDEDSPEQSASHWFG